MRGSLRRLAQGALWLVLGLMTVGRSGPALAEAPPEDRSRSIAADEGRRAAPSEDRSEARPSARPRWRDGGPRERRVRREALQGLVLALPDARPGERLAIVRQAASLPPEERHALRERLRRYDALAPDERRAVDDALARLRARAGDDVERFERNLGRWEKLSEADRERYREQMQRLREMSVEERRQLLEDWERSGRGRSGAAGGREEGAGRSGSGSDGPDGEADPTR